MKRVIVESPFAGSNTDPEIYDLEVRRNIIYARFCMNDCLVNHNESPYASHLLYTQEFVLDDKKEEERKLGIEAGFEWRAGVESVFYIDLGISRGMRLGMDDAEEKGLWYSIRHLPTDLFNLFEMACMDRGLPYQK